MHILSDALSSLNDLEPRFSTQKRAIDDIIETLLEVESIVETIDAFKPGLLRAVESSALEEMQVIHAKPPAEVTALIQRYVGRVAR